MWEESSIGCRALKGGGKRTEYVKCTLAEGQASSYLEAAMLVLQWEKRTPGSQLGSVAELSGGWCLGWPVKCRGLLSRKLGGGKYEGEGKVICKYLPISSHAGRGMKWLSVIFPCAFLCHCEGAGCFC